MAIVDAQIHVWGGLLPGAKSSEASAFTYRELLPMMDTVAVDRAVLVPPSWAADGNGTAIGAAEAFPDRFVVMGRIAIEKPESRGTIAQFMGQPGMVGVRLALRREPHATYLADGTVDWFWPEAAEAGLQVMVYAPGKLAQIRDIARRHPTLRIIIDHMGVNPGATDAERHAQFSDTISIAAEPNVAVKLSALPLYSNQPFPHRDTLELVYRLEEAFGATRCFWGSDMTRLDSYSNAVRMLSEEADKLGSEQKALIMGDALLAWLDWT